MLGLTNQAPMGEKQLGWHRTKKKGEKDRIRTKKKTPSIPTLAPGAERKKILKNWKIEKLKNWSRSSLSPNYEDALRWILRTWSFMLSMRLNTLSHPSQSQGTPGLCFASCRSRSFLLEKPPSVDWGQSSWRQNSDLVCRRKCLRKSQPLVKTADEVQPGCAQRQLWPSGSGNPKFCKSAGLFGEVDRELSENLTWPDPSKSFGWSGCQGCWGQGSAV